MTLFVDIELLEVDESDTGTRVVIVDRSEPDVSVVTEDVRGMISMLESDGVAAEPVTFR